MLPIMDRCYVPHSAITRPETAQLAYDGNINRDSIRRHNQVVAVDSVYSQIYTLLGFKEQQHEPTARHSRRRYGTP